MTIINDNNFLLENTCVTVGKFDGIHKGHKRLLNEMLKYKGKYKTVVLTFDFTQFRNTLSLPIEDNSRICSFEEKKNILEEMGIDYLIILPFDRSLADMEPERFISEVLVDRLGVSVFICGKDFTFGKAAEGTYELLLEKGAEYGFRTVICDDVMYQGKRISSSRIREDIRNNRYSEAEDML